MAERQKPSPARMAQVARYNASPARKAANARYYATARGRAIRQRSLAASNQRRLFIGQRYVGVAPTADDAAAINTHIKDRLTDLHRRTECHSHETADRNAS